MTTPQIETTLTAMTRREIARWAAGHGIRMLHLSHYRKAELVGYIAGEAGRLGVTVEPAPVEKVTKEMYRPHVKAAAVYGTYLVESERFRGEFYRVDPLLDHCSCPATKPCKHIFIAAQVHDALLRMRYAVRAQQRRQAAEAAGAFPVAA